MKRVRASVAAAGILFTLLVLGIWGQGHNPNYFANAAVTNTVVQVKATSTQVFGWNVGNGGTAICYLQMFNNIPANITLGTTVPNAVVQVPVGGLNIQPNPGSRVFGGQADGMIFGSGLSIAFTLGPTPSATACTGGTAAVVMFIR